MTTPQLQCSILNAEISNVILNVKKKKRAITCALKKRVMGKEKSVWNGSQKKAKN